MPLNLDEQREIEALADLTANQSISTGTANIKTLAETINAEIEQISDVRILEGIEGILQTMRSDKEKLVKDVVGELGETKKKWQIAEHPTEALIKESLKVFQDYFADRFKDDEHKPDLGSFNSDGIFAKNILSHLAINPSASKGIMNSFCDYILALSYLSNENIATKLESFPPKIASDINCLGGSGSDIDDLIKKMTVSSEDKILFEIHQLLTMQIVSRFNRTVYVGNQKHTPPCLSFILGVESKDVIMNVILDPHYKLPRSDISTHLAHDEIHKYFDSFKKHLKNNEGVMAEIRNAAFNKIRLFQERYNANDLALATNIDTVGQHNLDIRNTLSAEEKIPVTSLMKEDEEGNYVWDEEKITQHMVKNSLNRLFPEYPSKDIIKPSSQDEALLQRMNNNSNLFTEAAQQDLMLALKSENNAILSTGIRNLWLLGAKFNSNSPIQFCTIMDSLIDPKDGSIGLFTFEDETKKIIKLNPEFAPHLSVANRDKLAEIPEYYKTHITNPDVVKYKRQLGQSLQNIPLTSTFFPCPELETLLNGNASKEKILDCLNAFKELTRPTVRSRLIKSNLLLKSMSQLENRPDKIEILKAIKGSGITLSDGNFRYFTQAALKNKDFDLYQVVIDLTDSQNNKTLLSNLTGAIIQNNTQAALFLIDLLQKINSPDALKKLLDQNFSYFIKGNNLISRQSKSHGSLIHIAAGRGNVSVINALAQHGVDLNKKNNFSPSPPVITYRNSAASSGQTPAHAAATYGKTEVIKLLRKLGANLDLHDSFRERPIHCAIKGGYSTTLEALIGEENEEGRVCITRKPFRIRSTDSVPQNTGPFKSLPNIKEQLSNLIESSPAITTARYLTLPCLKQLLDNGLVLEAAELNRMSQIVTNRMTLKYSPRNLALVYQNQTYKDLLEFLFRKGASSPYAPDPPEYIKETLDKQDHFESIARAITKFARNNLEKPLFANHRELVAFKNEICRQLIETYDFKPEQMLEDFELTKEFIRLIPNGRTLTYEEHQRDNLPRFKLDLEKKYRTPIGEKAGILGEILAQKITSSKERPISAIPVTQTKFSLSEENAQSFLEILSSREGIENAISPPKLKQKPKTTIKSNSYTSTKYSFGERIQPEDEIER